MDSVIGPKYPTGFKGACGRFESWKQATFPKSFSHAEPCNQASNPNEHTRGFKLNQSMQSWRFYSDLSFLQKTMGETRQQDPVVVRSPEHNGTFMVRLGSILLLGQRSSAPSM